MAIQEDITAQIVVMRSVLDYVYPWWTSVGILLLGFFSILEVLSMNLLLIEEMDFRELGGKHDSCYLGNLKIYSDCLCSITSDPLVVFDQ